MIRSLMRTSIFLTRPLLKPSTVIQPTLSLRLQAQMAKVSKKEQMNLDKKKEKNKMKEELGGSVEEVDLTKYEEKYDGVVASFKQQLSTIRVGRLEPASLNSIDVKVGAQNFPLNALAQVTAKGANICVVSPFDSSQLDIVEKAIRSNDDTLDIKRQ